MPGYHWAELVTSPQSLRCLGKEFRESLLERLAAKPNSLNHHIEARRVMLEEERRGEERL